MKGKDFARQLVPFLLVLLLLGNIYLYRALSDHDRQVNDAWTYQTSEFLKFNGWAMGEVDRLLQTGGDEGSGAQTVSMVRETLESLQFLPHHVQRLDPEDERLIDSFYGYVQLSLTYADREYQAEGKFSDSTVARLKGIREALSAAADLGKQVDGLRGQAGVWRHAQWKAMWHGLAVELRNVDLEPLPEPAPPASGAEPDSAGSK